MRPLTSQFSASVGATRPGREEDVRRGGAAHGRGDRVSVLEIGGQRGDSLVETVRATAQARDLPAVGEEPLREVAAADARHADDERAPAHRGLPRRGVLRIANVDITVFLPRVRVSDTAQ